MRIKMIALDLEATLIDNAISRQPRPGLHSFLEFCLEEFEEISLLTTVEESDARDVLYELEDAGAIPSSFASMVGYIDWEGEYKDLRFAMGVEPREILFVDDDSGWIHPDQADQWVPVSAWVGGNDSELFDLKQRVSQKVKSINNQSH